MFDENLMNEAENATETKPEYATWGQVAMDMFEAVWPKGFSAPERFDASIHKASDRFVRVEITIIPLDEMNARFPTEFKGNVTGWNNRDWAAVTLPSIKALGIPVKSLPDRFVKTVKKPNGKMYDKKKDGVKTGEKGELTDFLFVKVFENQDACLADYLSEKAGDPVTQASADAFPTDVPPVQAAAAPSVQAGPGDAILLKFAQAIVTSAAKNAPGDLPKITALVRAQLDANPVMKGKYSADSAEVLTMIIAAVTA